MTWLCSLHIPDLKIVIWGLELHQIRHLQLIVLNPLKCGLKM